ncbi:MAG: fatty acyl-AMP ligase, partial [Gammaproteobacteria bacterium]
LPVSIRLGGHRAYVSQLQNLLRGCRASIAMAPAGLLEFLNEAVTDELGLRRYGSAESYDALPEQSGTLQPLGADEMAYIQYTSGSTRFPRGVVISQRQVMSNLACIIRDGLQIGSEDRCMSWLPYYHDMGMVGFVLAPLAAQRSVDYLDTHEFAMRPRCWLDLMARNRATVSFSPPFGYELCARRVSADDAARYDLSAWRVAGVGAETIRPETLEKFAEALELSGFKATAFLPCYGMAECSLGISFTSLGRGLEVDRVDADHLAAEHVAVPAGPDTSRASGFVKCGPPLPGHEVVIRDPQGHSLPERHAGAITVRGPSVMSGYFEEPELTRACLSSDGWLDTGDLGYIVDGNVVITGRKSDLIIVNGRNIWPQDLEYLGEQQEEVRPGDASAFSVPGPDGRDRVVVVIQCRVADPARRTTLVRRLHRLIHEMLGIDSIIELVPPHTLPRTSSGKLSRSAARRDYLRRLDEAEEMEPSTGPAEAALGG